jgi:hypothetical protein
MMPRSVPYLDEIEREAASLLAFYTVPGQISFTAEW